jgi:hypothetical protein
MEIEKSYKREPNLGFIIGCMLKYNFHSFKRFLIYIFHYCKFLNLREKESCNYTDIDIINILSQIFPNKIDKKDLYELTNCSKNTFNKLFKEYFELKGYTGKRKFTLSETYGILNEWQGEGQWGMMESIKKEKLVKIINIGNYKNLAKEFSLVIGEEDYKSKNLFSPKEVKFFLAHIDLSESREADIFRYDEFKTISLWYFGIMILSIAFNKNKHSIKQ